MIILPLHFKKKRMISSIPPPEVQRFIEYLQIRTVQPNPDYATCTEFLRRQAQELGLGFQATEYVPGKPVVVLTWPGKDPTLPSIILNSHTDVVPVTEDKWNYDPFGATRVPTDDGDYRIYARGTQDMKIVGHGYLEGVRKLKSEGTEQPQLLRTVHLVFVPDEEIGGHDGMAQFIKSPEFVQLNAGFALDEGMASTTDELRVFYGERAPCWVTFVAEGPTGHGSGAVKDAATERIVALSSELIEFCEKERQKLWSGECKQLGDITTANLTQLKAGQQQNIIPARASVGFDIRISPTGTDRQKFHQWLMGLAAKYDAQVEFNQFWDDSTTTPLDGSKFCKAFLGSVEQQGWSVAPEIFPAATDSRYLRRAGVLALGVSPLTNIPVLLHDHNEYVREGDVMRSVDFYAQLIKSISEVE